MVFKRVNNLSLKAGIALVILIAVAPLALFYFAIQSQYKTVTVSIKQTQIKAQIATTSQEKARGLCCRESLQQNAGMLFMYDKPGNYRYWMKDTKIPLDIYWIDASKKIVHIEPSVKPESYPKEFGTDIPSQYVLETNAGFAKTHNIQTGDIVRF